MEFHPPGYEYLGPGTLAEKNTLPTNRLDAVARRHDAAYGRARGLRDKWKADREMIRALRSLPVPHTLMERLTLKIMQTKLFFGL